MSAITALRADDLLTLPPLPDGGYYELSRGELITVSRAGRMQEEVKATVHEILAFYARQSRTGKVYGEALFKLTGDSARQPDVAFVLHEHRMGSDVDDKLISFVPDIAIEVISKSEVSEYSERKVQEYLDNGVSEVWQIYPRSRVLLVHSRQQLRELHAGDVVESPVLPGFQCKLSEFFEFWSEPNAIPSRSSDR